MASALAVPRTKSCSWSHDDGQGATRQGELLEAIRAHVGFSQKVRSSSDAVARPMGGMEQRPGMVGKPDREEERKPASGWMLRVRVPRTLASNRRREWRRRRASRREWKLHGGNAEEWKRARAATALARIAERALERTELHVVQLTAQVGRASARPKPQSESPRGRATCQEGEALPSLGQLRLSRGVAVESSHQPGGCSAGIGVAATRRCEEARPSWVGRKRGVTGSCEASSYQAGLASERA